MGIPGLYGDWLTKVASSAILRGFLKQGGINSSLSIDMNGLIHEARGMVFGEVKTDKQPKLSKDQQAKLKDELNALPEDELHGMIFRQTTDLIQTLVDIYDPRDGLILAVDGVAPGPKISQQRSRREKTSAGGPVIGFDRNAITPGTDFMIKLDAYIREFLKLNVDKLPPLVIYSSHLVPGEGEHKIFDYYRSGILNRRSSGRHILYGLDADLIMLSLLSSQPKIHLSRQSVREVISIDRLKEVLMGMRISPSNFVIGTMFLGNDFLPAMTAYRINVDVINNIINTIVTLDLQLAIQGEDNEATLPSKHHFVSSINWKDMSKLLIALAKTERSYFVKQLKDDRINNRSKLIEGAVVKNSFSMDKYRLDMYRVALLPRSTSLLSTLYGDVSNEDVIDMCRSYLNTIAWTFLYYTKGTMAVDHDWSYNYRHAPLFQDLAYVSTMEPLDRYRARDDMVIFNALQQLVAVIPRNSVAVLPEELRGLLTDDDSPLRDYYPKKFIVELDGKKHDHEGVAIIPFIDRKRVIDAVGTIPFSPERAKLWIPHDTLFIESKRQRY